jgi:formamidopyrimidine-DNA glycosylase
VPEGPEVETIRRGLEQEIVGQQLSRVEVIFEKSFPETVIRREELVVGAQVTEMSRRGKVLIIRLSNGYALLFHLKMTGQIVLVKAGGIRFAGGHPTESMRDSLPDRSTRVVFTFESGDLMYFNDQRKFGWIKLVTKDDIEQDSLIRRLGPEVLSEHFSVGYLAAQLKRHARAPIKAIILDQSVAAGVGNIYADEALHLARLHPSREAGSLKPVEVKRLHASIRDIIALGIQHGGTSFSHYVNSLGGTGDYLAQARVFRREGKPCPVCGTTIQKIRVAGRGSHICPKCQKLPRANKS